MVARLESWFEDVRYDLPDPAGDAYNKYKTERGAIIKSDIPPDIDLASVAKNNRNEKGWLGRGRRIFHREFNI